MFERYLKYEVTKLADAEKFLSEEQKQAWNDIIKTIQDGREKDGKVRCHSYVVVNQDLPYAETVWKLIQSHEEGIAALLEPPEPVGIEHTHVWDDGDRFTHCHKRGDIPHGHHGARYLLKSQNGLEPETPVTDTDNGLELLSKEEIEDLIGSFPAANKLPINNYLRLVVEAQAAKQKAADEDLVNVYATQRTAEKVREAVDRGNAKVAAAVKDLADWVREQDWSHGYQAYIIRPEALEARISEEG